MNSRKRKSWLDKYMGLLKKILIFSVFSLFLIPSLVRAQENDSIPTNSTTFKAKVIEILAVEEKTREDGSKYKQQNLKLLGLEGDWKEKEIVYNGITEIQVDSSNFYKIGDTVYIDRFIDEAGVETFYVVDFVRTGYIYVLLIIFIAVVLLIGRYKGFKALLSLVLSFIIIIKFILPQILAGRDPFLVSLIGGVIILAIIIYLTEGFKKKSHIAIVSVLLSLLTTLILSLIFTKLTRLTGLAQEDASFLIGVGAAEINFKGLLLAGFIIGAIGVLDDIVVGQIEAVSSIREANPSLSPKKIFKLAYRVGNTHLGAIINTLFLTYAGAALPLLLLFILNQDANLTFNRLINTEVVSTEIVRTLVGSIGVMLSMPIATFLAAFKK